MRKQLTVLLLLALVLGTGCSRIFGETAAAEPHAAAAPVLNAVTRPNMPAAPARPMFHGSVMGMDTSKPLATVDLTPGGLPGMTIQAPEGTRVETERGRAMVSEAGVNYSISIHEGDFDGRAAHSDFHLLDPQGTFVTEQPDMVIFERSSGGGDLLDMGVTVGTRHFTCHSVATGMKFTRETIEQTATSCRTLHSGT